MDDLFGPINYENGRMGYGFYVLEPSSSSFPFTGFWLERTMRVLNIGRETSTASSAISSPRPI